MDPDLNFPLRIGGCCGYGRYFDCRETGCLTAYMRLRPTLYQAAFIGRREAPPRRILPESRVFTGSRDAPPSRILPGSTVLGITITSAGFSTVVLAYIGISISLLVNFTKRKRAVAEWRTALYEVSYRFGAPVPLPLRSLGSSSSRKHPSPRIKACGHDYPVGRDTHTRTISLSQDKFPKISSARKKAHAAAAHAL